MPDLNHLWQRFLLATALAAGLLIGIGLTVFGYSNLTTVDVRWSVFHLDGVPLWTVAIVPIAVILIAYSIYHWLDGLHHFTEHMRHRRRVHELEAEVARLRAHLDQALEMPAHDATARAARPPDKGSLPAAETAAIDLEMTGLESTEAQAAPPKSGGDRKKRARPTADSTPEPQAEPAAATNGAEEKAPAELAEPAVEA